ncbi:hypothetical protein [Chitinivibrio alkaliphilus]|uniref:O-antigen polymerase n=1 Tax=Chitinivibrio alkaliphilus ACht1 TaxID=1313304 RepID=U7D762_9BACT|nr:hypothetical protein [Chitinivibrio alkaliphilus]ERP31401.1 hypothetical protein CALK_1751 [Chitinivibrio alkaliphilus ACht1]
MIPLGLFFVSIALLLQNKRKEAVLFFLFYATGGMGFLGHGYSFAGVSFRSTDLAIGFILCLTIQSLFWYKMGVARRSASPPILGLWKLFVGYLVVLIFIDQLFDAPSLSDTYRMMRQWIILSVLFLIPILSPQEQRWCIEKVVLLTMIQLFFFFMQPVVGYEISQGITRINEFGSGFLRYINFPTYWPVALWYFAFHPSLSPNKKIAGVTWVLVTLSITLSRSLYGTITLGVFLYGMLFLPTAQKIKLFLVFLIIAAGLLSFPPLRNRLATGFDEIEYIMAYDGDIEALRGRGNMTFRTIHFIERFQYLSTSPRLFLFGLGFIHEQSMTDQIFTVGLLDERNNVIQLDTGDIAWSLILIRFGMLGVVFVILLNITMIRFFWKHRTRHFGKIGFVYCASTFITSLAYPEMARASYYIVPFIMISYLHNTRNIDEENSPSPLLS